MSASKMKAGLTEWFQCGLGADGMDGRSSSEAGFNGPRLGQ